MLPDLFEDLDTFQDWFALPATAAYAAGSPRATRLIGTLHAILRPFLLRRLKADVEAGLPPKKEYVLYAPLSVRQREVYDAVLAGHLRTLLMKAGRAEPVREEVGPRKSRRARGAKRYDQDGDDDEYFRKLENGELEAEEARRKDTQTAEELGREWQYKTQRKRRALLECAHPRLTLRVQ